jgi:hypothetical protein
LSGKPRNVPSSKRRPFIRCPQTDIGRAIGSRFEGIVATEATRV